METTSQSKLNSTSLKYLKHLLFDNYGLLSVSDTPVFVHIIQLQILKIEFYLLAAEASIIFIRRMAALISTILSKLIRSGYVLTYP